MSYYELDNTNNGKPVIAESSFIQEYLRFRNAIIVLPAISKSNNS